MATYTWKNYALEIDMTSNTNLASTGVLVAHTGIFTFEIIDIMHTYTLCLLTTIDRDIKFFVTLHSQLLLDRIQT